VVAVGRGRRDKKGKVHAMDVNKGDRIIFPQYAGDEIEFEKTK
jgi:co-chaperonin GroES (HSP10)